MAGKNQSFFKTRIMKSIKHIIAILSLLLLSFWTSDLLAQNPAKLLRDGNKAYHKEDFETAEKKYLEANEKSEDTFKSGFNLGTALYKQEKYEEAAKQFESMSKITDDKEMKAKAYHNLGNSLFKQEMLQESIDAYKNALRNNPKDADTRRNLAKALQMLQEQEEQQDGDDENEEDKDQEKDENQDGDNKKDEKDNENQENDQQEQDKNDEQNKEQEQKEQEQRENELSKEEAERMLDAIKNEEEDLLQELQKRKGQKINIEKDW